MPPLHAPVAVFLAGFALGRASAEPTLRHIRDAYHEAVYLAEHDPLTGLPTRAAAHRHYSQHLGQPWTVILIDLDDFAAINDRYGHAAGDMMLVEIADRLHHAADTSHGRAFRLAGTEFLVQLPAGNHHQTALDTVYNTATADLPPHLAAYTRRGIQQLSFGHARCDGLSWSEALHHADIALYHAKLHGEFHTYLPGMYHPQTPPPDQRRTRLRNLPIDDVQVFTADRR